MPLTPGTRLGPYEILSPIGAGGMGEVYRAKDTKLDREVAIKVLPAALAQDRERLARFEREAKVLASLNHPNIAQIYGLEESANTRALVMELVAGSTLSVPQPLNTALSYARQIAEALEAAHEKGITHRDLKPANILITPEGVVKVLDFGLASIPAKESASDPANSPTLTMTATQAGTIMGTAGYMSPEQAVGKPVDKRADIWSFGVVLWEMLAGSRMFGGETMSHTLADVLRAPIDLARLKDAPPPIRQLLKRCLDRDVKSRLRDIGEARIAIQDWLANPVPVEAEQAPPSRPFALIAALAALAASSLIATGLAFVHFREAAPEVRAVSTTLLPPDGTEFDFSNPHPMPAISPDGTRVVFGAKSKDGKRLLWVRRLDSPAAQPLPGTEDAATPFWSPDSRWVAFGQEHKLKKIDIQGGPPLPITDISRPLRGGSWNTEGTIVFGVNGGRSILRVAASGGAAVPVTPTADSGPPRHPEFLPDGRHFLYLVSKLGNQVAEVGSLDEPGKPGKVVATVHSATVFAGGYLLYLRDNTLMAQSFDPNRLETKGEALPLAENVPVFTNASRIPGFAVSRGGLLVYLSGGQAGETALVWRDRQGKPAGNLGERSGAVVGVSISPDGKSVAAGIGRDSANYDIWIYDVARGVRSRFTANSGNNIAPIWSPDGKQIYFISNIGGPSGLYGKAANGTGSEEIVLPQSLGSFPRPESISPDGKRLLFGQSGEKTGRDLWVLPIGEGNISGKSEPRAFLQTSFNEAFGRFSSDGTWVAYASDESGKYQVYAAPFPGPGGKRQISPGTGRQPVWRKDGKELFYVTAEGHMMAVEVAIRGDALEVGRVQKLFEGVAVSGSANFDVTADGQKFLMKEGSQSAAHPMTLLQNWTAALRK